MLDGRVTCQKVSGVELSQFSKNEREEICTMCEGCGLYRGRLCTNCNGHAKVLVLDVPISGDIKRTVHSYEPTMRVQQMIASGLII